MFKRIASLLLILGIVMLPVITVRADEITPQERILERAYEQVGDRYVWGAGSTGEDPDSFDCSSLIQWLFRGEGIELPRCSNEQKNCGYEVNMAELQPCDIITFVTNNSRGGDVTHVALYIGDGKILHARNSRMGVRIDDYNDYWQSITYNCRRIIN